MSIHSTHTRTPTPRSSCSYNDLLQTNGTLKLLHPHHICPLLLLLALLPLAEEGVEEVKGDEEHYADYDSCDRACGKGGGGRGTVACWEAY